MRANTLIKPAVLALKPSDSIAFALEQMAQYRLPQLPVVEGIYLQGMVDEDQLMDVVLDPQVSIRSLVAYQHEKIAFEQQHLHQIIHTFLAQQLSVLPMVNAQNEYLGLITAKELLQAVSSEMAVAERGSMVVLEMSSRDYSLEHLAHLVEEKHAVILGTSLRSFPDTTRLEVTLKINKDDVDSIVSSFERHQYTVLDVFNGVAKNESPSLERYNHLMNYLNL